MPTPEQWTANTHQHVLLHVIPTDPRDWWTGDEVDTFLRVWDGCGLPMPVLSDATGEILTLWVADVRAVAVLVDMSHRVGNDESFTLAKGEYKVCVAQANEATIRRFGSRDKETKHA